MMVHFSKVHNRFKYNGSNYTFDYLKHLAVSLIKEGDANDRQIGDFLLDWIDAKDYVTVYTSGSTGTPKAIKILKQYMVNSAIATGDFFKLSPGDSALMCLPANYIAGKMMLVRAIILGLELDVISPNLEGLNHFKSYDFTALVPLQLQKLIDNKLNFKTIIVGGAPISSSLIRKIRRLSVKVFETYGMTETVTHIALRLLNREAKSEDNPFKVLPGVKISKNINDCLIIDAPSISKNTIQTNDIVHLVNDNSFKLVGRHDNIINSGGIKLSPETIEQKLSEFIPNRFIIASEPDEILGERVILVVESGSKLKTINFQNLTKYEIPKAIYYLKSFINASNNKINRRATIKKLFNN